jgi:hypothetical protein
MVFNTPFNIKLYIYNNMDSWDIFPHKNIMMYSFFLKKL